MISGACAGQERKVLMVHNQLHTIDLVIIGVYLAAMVAIGLVVVKKVRDMDD